MAELLSTLRQRRDRECRLAPDRALASIDGAHEFVRKRGLVTRTADCALPGLYEACHAEPELKWSWAAELAELPDVHSLAIHRGKTILLSDEVLALADPVCRAELARMEGADRGWNRLLRHLAETGPALADDVEVELGMKHKELRSIRSPLERCGALVARTVQGSATELARFDQAYPEQAPGPMDIVALLGAGLRAAVLAPEMDMMRWFSWRWLLPKDLIDQLVGRGLAVRPAPGWLAAPSSGD